MSWRIDVALSTNSFSKVLKPEVQVKMTKGDEEISFHMTVQQFQEFRRHTAGILKDMFALDQFAFIRNLNYNTSNTASSMYRRSRDGGTTWDPEVDLGNCTFWPGIATAPGTSYVYLTINSYDSSGSSQVYFRRSSDNGATWQPLQQLSNASGRSEDPAMSAYGNLVYIVWNDNRSGTMEVMYRRSADNGQTWGVETPLTKTPANTYTPTVFASSPTSVSIAYIDHEFGANIWHIMTLISNDGGLTFGVPFDHTPNDTQCSELYPSLVQVGSNIHLAWTGDMGCSSNSQKLKYQLSKDGGKSWSEITNLVNTGTRSPFSVFISVFQSVVHITWTYLSNGTQGQGQVYYSRNPTGNPITETV